MTSDEPGEAGRLREALKELLDRCPASCEERRFVEAQRKAEAALASPVGGVPPYAPAKALIADAQQAPRGGAAEAGQARRVDDLQERLEQIIDHYSCATDAGTSWLRSPTVVRSEIVDALVAWSFSLSPTDLRLRPARSNGRGGDADASKTKVYDAMFAACEYALENSNDFSAWVSRQERPDIKLEHLGEASSIVAGYVVRARQPRR
jgi:hypothetical protein